MRHNTALYKRRMPVPPSRGPGTESIVLFTKKSKSQEKFFFFLTFLRFSRNFCEFATKFHASSPAHFHVMLSLTFLVMPGPDRASHRPRLSRTDARHSEKGAHSVKKHPFALPFRNAFLPSPKLLTRRNANQSP